MLKCIIRKIVRVFFYILLLLFHFWVWENNLFVYLIQATNSFYATIAFICVISLIMTWSEVEVIKWALKED